MILGNIKKKIMISEKFTDKEIINTIILVGELKKIKYYKQNNEEDISFLLNKVYDTFTLYEIDVIKTFTYSDIWDFLKKDFNKKDYNHNVESFKDIIDYYQNRIDFEKEIYDMDDDNIEILFGDEIVDEEKYKKCEFVLNVIFNKAGESENNYLVSFLLLEVIYNFYTEEDVNDDGIKIIVFTKLNFKDMLFEMCYKIIIYLKYFLIMTFTEKFDSKGYYISENINNIVEDNIEFFRRNKNKIKFTGIVETIKESPFLKEKEKSLSINEKIIENLLTKFIINSVPNSKGKKGIKKFI